MCHTHVSFITCLNCNVYNANKRYVGYNFEINNIIIQLVTLFKHYLYKDTYICGTHYTLLFCVDM